MKQAIAGVAPAEVDEVTSMVVWPSIAAYPPGRVLGKAYSMSAGIYVVTVGNLIALFSIPIALALYFFRLVPSTPFRYLPHGKFYKLTNRRVVELRNEIQFQPARLAHWLVLGGILTAPAILLLIILYGGLGWSLWPELPLAQILVAAAWLGVGSGLAPVIAAGLGVPTPMPRVIFDAESKGVELDRFDRVEVNRQPGQHWFDAGDLVFFQGDVETFRLDGVSRPEAFRQTCVKAQMAHAGVQEALQAAKR